MCRWLAYTGSPVPIAEMLFGGTNSIVSQSLTSYQGAEPTNGDGFGVGWYGPGDRRPSRYRSTEPAWNDGNLHEVTAETEARMIMAHVRATSGSPVQLTNCHPYRDDEILFMHNGVVEDFPLIHRDLLMAMTNDEFQKIQGSTDSEVLFHLAITHGLRDDPKLALELAVGHIEAAQEAAGVAPSVQMSVCVGNGDELFTLRYSTYGTPRTLYHSTDIGTLKRMYPDRAKLQQLDDGTHMVMSEPIEDLPGAWTEVPPSTYVHLREGSEVMRDFVPRRP